MKASELMGRPVRDATGTVLGVVHDLRVRLPGTDHPAAGASSPHVVALVVGPTDLRTRLAHSWGVAEGRTRGPAPLVHWLAAGATRTRRIEVDQVVDWDRDGAVQVGGGR